MSTAVAEIDVQPPLPRNPLAEGFGRLSSGQKIRALGGVVVLLAIVIAAIFMGKQTDWRVLFANLNDKDGGAIVAALQQGNVPYRFSEGGHAILVPSQFVHDTRLKLSAKACRAEARSASN